MKKSSRDKRNSHRSAHCAATAKTLAVPSRQIAHPSAAPSDISPAIAFLLGLKTKPAPARRPPDRLVSRAGAITAPAFDQDDCFTLALLTLPILFMICGLAITQTLKPLRRIDLAAAPTAIIPQAAVTPKPLLAPPSTLQLPTSPSMIATHPSQQPRDLATPPPAVLPELPAGLIPLTTSPAVTASPTPAALSDAAGDQTAMLAARPPNDQVVSPFAALRAPLASQDATLDPEPKHCTARPANPPLDLTNTTLTPAAFGNALATAARAQTHDLVIYNDKYRALSYPRGDVQPLYGVCTDVIIRAYRALGVDLQQLVHDTRIGNADTSIDHRRTETLRRFFARFGQQFAASNIAEDYLPGDIVTYDRPQNRGSRSHIALVSDVIAPSGRYMIVHNRGWGPQLEDALFVDVITGHYRYTARATTPLLANIPVISTPQKRQPALTRLASRSQRRLDGMSVNGLGR